MFPAYKRSHAAAPVQLEEGSTPGAIVGDMAASVDERRPVGGGWEDFPLFSPESRFTDDTVMPLAVADALRQAYGKDGLHDRFIDAMRAYGNAWPNAGYGKKFRNWLAERRRDACNSFGNGSDMRVSPVGWIAQSLEEAEHLAALSAATTHNHPVGIRGAQAVAAAIFLARSGKSKDEIRAVITRRHGYDLSRTLAEIREVYTFDVTCQGPVPEAITAFLESANFEEAVRKAVWLRGDADPQAAIAGSIAEAFYGEVPGPIVKSVKPFLLTGGYSQYCENFCFVILMAVTGRCLNSEYFQHELVELDNVLRADGRHPYHTVLKRMQKKYGE